jgi:hypothetical protein
MGYFLLFYTLSTISFQNGIKYQFLQVSKIWLIKRELANPRILSFLVLDIVEVPSF